MADNNMQNLDSAKSKLRWSYGKGADWSAFNGMDGSSTSYNTQLQEFLETNTKNDGKGFFGTGKGNGADTFERGAASLGRSQIQGADKLLNTAFGRDLHQYTNMAKRDSAKNAGKFTFEASLSHGYNQGFSGAIAASKGTHALNGLNALVGLSAGESMLNSIGITTKAQRVAAKGGGKMAKIGNMAIPGMVGAMSVSQMMNGDDAGDIAVGNLSIGFMQMGFRAGKSIGGISTADGAGVARMVGMGVGGVVGAVGAMAAVQGAYAGVKDMTSNESGIAKAARKIYKRESVVNTQESRDTLTARQRNFQKLSASGMNDRSALLGNESLVLRNLM